MATILLLDIDLVINKNDYKYIISVEFSVRAQYFWIYS